MTAPDTANGRVTLAVLGAKLDIVIQQQKNILEKQDLTEAVVYEHSVHIETLSGQVATQCQRLDGRIDNEVTRAAKDRMRLDGRIDRTNDKVKGWQGIQAALTLVASTIAAWLGFKL